MIQEQPEIILENKTSLFWRIQDQQPQVLESVSPTNQLFNQHFMDIYLSQCYHQHPQKLNHIQT